MIVQGLNKIICLVITLTFISTGPGYSYEQAKSTLRPPMKSWPDSKEITEDIKHFLQYGLSGEKPMKVSDDIGKLKRLFFKTKNAGDKELLIKKLIRKGLFLNRYKTLEAIEEIIKEEPETIVSILQELSFCLLNASRSVEIDVLNMLVRIAEEVPKTRDGTVLILSNTLYDIDTRSWEAFVHVNRKKIITALESIGLEDSETGKKVIEALNLRSGYYGKNNELLKATINNLQVKQPSEKSVNTEKTINKLRVLGYKHPSNILRYAIEKFELNPEKIMSKRDVIDRLKQIKAAHNDPKGDLVSYIGNGSKTAYYFESNGTKPQEVNIPIDGLVELAERGFIIRAFSSLMRKDVFIDLSCMERPDEKRIKTNNKLRTLGYKATNAVSSYIIKKFNLKPEEITKKEDTAEFLKQMEIDDYEKILSVKYVVGDRIIVKNFPIGPVVDLAWRGYIVSCFIGGNRIFIDTFLTEDFPDLIKRSKVEETLPIILDPNMPKMLKRQKTYKQSL
jgi:hypothetical protein